MTNGKTALVTGSSRGIGRAIARRLARDGYRIVIHCAQNREKADTLRAAIEAEGGQAEVLQADLSDLAQTQALCRRLPPVDVLVLNASMQVRRPWLEIPPEECLRQLDCNFVSSLLLIQAVVPGMKAKGWGRIVAIGSVQEAKPHPEMLVYSASKAAINSYTMALANELRPFGITVCAVMPGDLKTGFTAAREKNVRGDAEYGGRISRSVSRMEHDEQTGMPPEKAAAFLCRVALRCRTRPLYAIGPQYSAAVLLGRLLPCRLVSWIVSKLYAA